MFAGALAAWNGLSPLIRYGAYAGAVLLLLGSIWGWKEYQQYQGRQQQRAAQEIEFRKQAQASIQDVQAQSDLKQVKVERLAEDNSRLVNELNDAQKVIDELRKRKPKTVDMDAIRIVDHLARVLDGAVPAERVPAASETTGLPPLQEEAATCPVDVGMLVQRIKDLTDRDADSEQGHEALSSYVVEKYHKELAAYEKSKR